MARAWKQGVTLFLPGCTAGVLGGTVFTLLLFLLLLLQTLPLDPKQRLEFSHLPVDEQAVRPADRYRLKAISIYLFPSGDVDFFDEGDRWIAADERATALHPEVIYRLHIDRRTTWRTIRTLLRELKASGSVGVLIAVRNSDRESGDVWCPLDDALPQLDVNALAQEFVDSIR